MYALATKMWLKWPIPYTRDKYILYVPHLGFLLTNISSHFQRFYTEVHIPEMAHVLLKLILKIAKGTLQICDFLLSTFENLALLKCSWFLIWIFSPINKKDAILLFRFEDVFQLDLFLSALILNIALEKMNTNEILQLSILILTFVWHKFSLVYKTLLVKTIPSSV